MPDPNQVSSSFLDVNRPVNSLMTAARKGRRPVEEAATRLREQAAALADLAADVCQLFGYPLATAEAADPPAGGPLVLLAARQVAHLSDQLVNAAIVLAEVPQSKAADENAILFQVRKKGKI